MALWCFLSCGFYPLNLLIDWLIDHDELTTPSVAKPNKWLRSELQVRWKREYLIWGYELPWNTIRERAEKISSIRSTSVCRPLMWQTGGQHIQCWKWKWVVKDKNFINKCLTETRDKPEHWQDFFDTMIYSSDTRNAQSVHVH